MLVFSHSQFWKRLLDLKHEFCFSPRGCCFACWMILTFAMVYFWQICLGWTIVCKIPSSWKELSFYTGILHTSLFICSLGTNAVHRHNSELLLFHLKLCFIPTLTSLFQAFDNILPTDPWKLERRGLIWSQGPFHLTVLSSAISMMILFFPIKPWVALFFVSSLVLLPHFSALHKQTISQYWKQNIANAGSNVEPSSLPCDCGKSHFICILP